MNTLQIPTLELKIRELEDRVARLEQEMSHKAYKPVDYIVDARSPYDLSAAGKPTRTRNR